jgi:hypothetical protein
VTKKQMQETLDKIAELSVQLDAAVKKKYGRDAFIFAEAEGGIHIMKGDADPDRGNSTDRQKFIAMTAEGKHSLGVGAW